MSRRRRETPVPNGEPEHHPLTVALRELLGLLPPDIEDVNALTASARKVLGTKVKQVVASLQEFGHRLDPIGRPGFVFDPADPAVIGRLIAITLLDQPRVPLADVSRFYGSGVYAIYYRGSFQAYAPIRGGDVPIYVGKVDPERQGATTVEEQGTKLRDRLVGDHARSIAAVDNLEVADFDCRYLVVKSAWQNTAETYLIDRFHPVWNNESGVCFGIGKHGDAAATRGNTRSPWDELHPGRSWAWATGNRPNPKGRTGILDDITEHFRRHPPDEAAR
jgi:hypothetical protein